MKTVIYKSWDWVRPPSPSLGQISNFYRKFVLGAPLKEVYKKFHSSDSFTCGEALKDVEWVIVSIAPAWII